MKKTAFLFLLAAAAMSAAAQVDPAPASAAAADDAAAQHARIDAQRKAIEQRYDGERAQCYQRFAVQDCLNESRRRRRVQVDELNRQETALNDIERKRRGDAALQRLEDKGAPPVASPAPGPKEGARGMQGQADREQQAADRAARRAAEAAEASANQKAYADKQRRHAEEAAQRQQEAAQAAAERERYEQRLQKAQEEQAARAKREAERTKPRGAPLPVPE